MSDGLLIVGNGGHGKIVLDCARINGIKKVAFLVNYDSPNVLGVKCINENAVNILELKEEYPYLIVALGDNDIRIKKSLEYEAMGFKLKTLIHPRAFVSDYATVGDGTVVLPFATINVCAKVGKACIINTGALVEHDCVIGDGVHMSPNSALGGNTKVGDGSWICLGSSVSDKIQIGDNCVVGAGASVIRNVNDNITVVGVPAKEKRKLF